MKAKADASIKGLRRLVMTASGTKNWQTIWQAVRHTAAEIRVDGLRK